MTVAVEAGPRRAPSGARSGALLAAASAGSIVTNYVFLLAAARVLGSDQYGSLAALLVPAGEAALKILGEPCYVIGSNLAVRTRREGRLIFVWKEESVEATPELLEELARFSADLAKLLEP